MLDYLMLPNVYSEYWPISVFSYIRFSAICASVVRAAMKPAIKVEALKAAESNVKVLRPKTACKSMRCNVSLLQTCIFNI